jgi:hypothetical protein
VVTDPFAVIQDDVEPDPVEPVEVALPGEIDSVEAAIYLNTTANNIRQMIHKKQLTVLRKHKRRAIFAYAEVHELGMIREFNRVHRKK